MKRILTAAAATTVLALIAPMAHAEVMAPTVAALRISAPPDESCTAKSWCNYPMDH